MLRTAEKKRITQKKNYSHLNTGKGNVTEQKLSPLPPPLSYISVHNIPTWAKTLFPAGFALTEMRVRKEKAGNPQGL